LVFKATNGPPRLWASYGIENLGPRVLSPSSRSLLELVRTKNQEQKKEREERVGKRKRNQRRGESESERKGAFAAIRFGGHDELDSYHFEALGKKFQTFINLMKSKKFALLSYNFGSVRVLGLLG